MARLDYVELPATDVAGHERLAGRQPQFDRDHPPRARVLFHFDLLTRGRARGERHRPAREPARGKRIEPARREPARIGDFHHGSRPGERRRRQIDRAARVTEIGVAG